MIAIYGVCWKIKKWQHSFEKFILSWLSPKSVLVWIIYEQLYTSRARSAAKATVFGYKFIEKRLLFRINIIYVVPGCWTYAENGIE